MYLIIIQAFVIDSINIQLVHCSSDKMWNEDTEINHKCGTITHKPMFVMSRYYKQNTITIIYIYIIMHIMDKETNI